MSGLAELFEQPSVRRILARAARASGMPVAVHELSGKRELRHLAGHGGCAACRYVNEIPSGKRACRQSRAMAASLAQRQRDPISFICHMSFGCVSVCPGSVPAGVITFGPYCPSGKFEALDDDVKQNLMLLDGGIVRVELPFSIEDIPQTSSISVAAVAEWVAEALDDLLSAEEMKHVDDDATNKVNAAVATPSPVKVKATQHAGLPGAVALALAGGRPALAREHFLSLVREGAPRKLGKSAVTTRYKAMVTLVLEAAQGAGALLDDAWPAYADFAARVEDISDEVALVEAADHIFRSIGWRDPVSANRRSGSAATLSGTTALKQDLSYAELNTVLLARYKDGITLSEAAAALGVTPTALTHRLQRRFGMSFSDYLGKIRVEKAKSLLLRTHLGIAEVALRVGVNDPSNMGRLFRRHTGISPSDYREQFGKDKMK